MRRAFRQTQCYTLDQFIFLQRKVDTENASEARQHIGLRIQTQNMQCYTGVTF